MSGDALLSRPADVALVTLAVLALAATQRGAATNAPVLAPYLAGFCLVVGPFLAHSLSIPFGSGLAIFPVFAAIVLGICLFVVPQVLAFERVLAVVAAIAATVVAVGLPSLVVGPYSIAGFEIRPWTNASVSALGLVSLPALRSVFPNPNTLGLVAFPGTIAGAIALERAHARERPAAAVAAALVAALALLGTYLSNSRASLLAALVGIAVYAVGTAGRRYVSLALGGLCALVLAGIAGIASGVLPVDPSGRIELWTASVEALLAGPTLFGSGVVATDDLIAPYLPEGLAGRTPHNSYLSIALRVGVVGLAGYLLLVVGPLVHGALAPERVDPGALALAVAFAIHQLFEGYTLLQYGPGAVLGALAVGYVLASLIRDPDRTEEPAETTKPARFL
ncbi:MAG: O-antigen ligase family protein [Halalkalicoccus sp.]